MSGIYFETLRPSEIDHVLKFKTESPGWVSRPRTHHILAYEIKGSSIHHFSDREFEIKDNTMMFFHKKDRYVVEKHSPESRCIAIHFSTEKECLTESFIIDASDNPKILAAFEKMYNICTSCGDCNSYEAMAQLYCILAIVEKAYDSSYSKSDKKLDGIIAYLNANYKEKIAVNTLADEYGVTPRRFNDIFKKKTGLSPMAYIIDLRIKEAKELLKLGYISVNEVAAETGFSDITYFSRIFKSKTGISPLQYKTKRM